jgi:small conductance mechanosensitive channel
VIAGTTKNAGFRTGAHHMMPIRARRVHPATGPQPHPNGEEIAMETLNSQFTETANQVATFVATYGLNVLGGVIVLIVGWLIARSASRSLERTLSRFEKIDVTLRKFFASLLKYVILVVTVIAVLNQFGVQTTSLIAVLGAAGLAIGLALQGTLANLAAGVMLLLFRPFKVGDYVIAGGQAGTVKEIDLFVTELATPDNVQILIPNGAIWGAAVTNYSHHATRRVDFSLGIDYGDDIDAAISTLREVIAAEGRCLGDPEPMVVVGELADSSVNLVVRVWCDSGDYWPLKFDLTKRFKEALEGAGVTIPFPQRTVHVLGNAPSAHDA